MNRFAAISAALCSATLLFACAIDIGPFFKPGESPENETAFRNGRLGLITPALNKADELIAFRYLSGLTLDKDAMNAGLRPSVMDGGNDTNQAGIQIWMDARRGVAVAYGLRPVSISSAYSGYRARQPSHYVFYPNCLNDAFVTAARTLADRQQRYISKSAFQDWLQAQDRVFANCSGQHPVYPEGPASDIPELVRADREYQIAAAHFYAEDLQAAKNLFSAIAEDQNSPWQKVGAYMVGRTLLREVSLENNREAESAARQQFENVAEDPSAGSLRNSAHALLQRVNAAETLQSLAKQLMLPHPSASFDETIHESRYVLLTEGFREALSKPNVPEPFDWVKTLESGDAHHAIERWRAADSLPWLTLALMYSSGRDTAASDLIQEANRIDRTSPAFVTANYNAIRLRIERGEREGPRAQLDDLLAKETNQPASVLNGWRAERMQLATSFDDFLRWAPRTPVLVGYEGGPRLANADSPVLANDSTYVLNYLTPLSKLVQAAHSERLPQWSAADVALTAWTRAFMLDERATMRDMAPILAKTHPDWAPNLTLPSAAEFEAWKFRAALLIAHNAEFEPLVPVDYWKHVESPSWWCAVAANRRRVPGNEEPTAAWRLPVSFEPSDAVISKTERSVAQKEIGQLQRIGSAQSLLAPIILASAKSHPEDPLVPEALHRIVMVVRYGCHSDPANGELSKAAFDLLHKSYPESQWAAKTPYWFK
jgi:hypothetical protein